MKTATVAAKCRVLIVRDMVLNIVEFVMVLEVLILPILTILQLYLQGVVVTMVVAVLVVLLQVAVQQEELALAAMGKGRVPTK